MGTRADFYVGRGETAEWLGSIAWDGYPSGIDAKLLKSKTEKTYRKRLAEFFANDRTDVTLPEMGWPWPWEDSRTTDYAYAFDGGKVYASCFGYEWFIATEEESDIDDDKPREKPAVFPQMDKKSMAMPGSKRSGIMVFSA